MAMKRSNWYLAGAIYTILFQCSAVLIGGTAYALPDTAPATTIAQSFTTNSDPAAFVSGALVSKIEDTSQPIELATQANSGKLIGVVTKQPLASLQNTAQSSVEVAILGSTQTLVSDINGPVYAGSKITASPIVGVGMLATGDTRIVGTALENFDIRTGTKQNIKDNKGVSRTIHIGMVSLQVSVSSYDSKQDSLVPAFVQNFADTIARKQVGLIRLLFSVAMLIAGIIITVSLAAGTVQAAIISVGRNPMASELINRSVLKAVLFTVVILGFSLLAAYVGLVV